MGLVLEGLADPLLSIAVRAEIRQAEEGIVVDQIVPEHVEDARLFIRGEIVRPDPVHHGTQFVMVLQEVMGIVSLLPEFIHLLHGHAEDEDVLGADFLADLDIGAIERSDRERSVEGELHVAGAGGFLAGCGDLL